MYLTQLNLENIRNIKTLQLSSLERLNFIVGPNGSGKTTLLEAIYLLGTGKSFRTHLCPRLIQYDAASLTAYGKFQTEEGLALAVGLTRKRQGALALRVNGELETRLSSLVTRLPLQVIEPNSHELLLGGPKYRRQFLDWGVFHVEPLFLSAWRQFQRHLKQRNAALQQGLSREAVGIWDEGFLTFAEQVDRCRREYVSKFSFVFNELVSPLHFSAPLEMCYRAGWGAEEEPTLALERAFARDRIMGGTQRGPHRADLVFTMHDMPAHDILSRGQQKLLVYLLKITQGILLQDVLAKKTIFLLDDLGAELDYVHRQIILKQLALMGCQCFITGLDPALLKEAAQYVDETALFHVEQGLIQPEKAQKTA